MGRQPLRRILEIIWKSVLFISFNGPFSPHQPKGVTYLLGPPFRFLIEIAKIMPKPVPAELKFTHKIDCLLIWLKKI